ncbi:unnamed protein product, partial [Phaeothamnion confervicola]
VSCFVYESDLGPGEIFGESVLEGLSARRRTVIAVTRVELLAIDAADYEKIRDRGHSHVPIERKLSFLKKVPLIKHMESYRRHQMAMLLRASEIPKGKVIVSPGEISKCLYFIVSGTAEVQSRVLAAARLL